MSRRSAQLPGALDEELNEFREERDMSYSEAIRVLLRDGLETRGADQHREPQPAYHRSSAFGVGLAVAAVAALALNLTTPYIPLTTVAILAAVTAGVNGFVEYQRRGR